jgi:hypothetical protein
VSEKFTWRFYCEGDSPYINELYETITTRPRTDSEYKWQWLAGPGGRGDIALIHAVDQAGVSRLIGHHGVMPLRFTNRDDDLLFGKIENTMVLPEYRHKIIYPRFEKRFKDVYESRYHALFSTFGPEAAIRVRQATGYEFPVSWINYKLATTPSAQLQYPFYLLSKKLKHSKNVSNWIARADGCEAISNQMALAGFLCDAEAERAPFFNDFWVQARVNYGVSPRRDWADLRWRFWTNPYKEHFTFVVDESRAENGYAIISINSNAPWQAVLEDYAVLKPSHVNYDQFFKALISALAKAGIKVLVTTTTSDEVLGDIASVFARYRFVVMGLKSLFLNKDKPRLMPRSITESGRVIGLDTKNWFVTGIIFEGRI